MTTRRAAGPAVLAACAIAVAACQPAGATKAGGSGDPVTLQLGTNDGDGAPATAVIGAFAHEVRNLSGGALLIEPVYQADHLETDEQPGWDQRIAGMVTGGELDMGLVPARAWDVEGVTSLRPFSAPMLMTSQDLVEDVLRSDLADDMLAGIDGTGATGLALIPESLRHVFSFGDPLDSPAAIAGTTVRAPRSDTVWAMFTAWGATADDLVGDEFTDAVASGAVAGAESSYARALELPGDPTTVAGNMTTAANVQTLVISTKTLDGLTDEQAGVLRRAARDVRDRQMESWNELAGAQDFCKAGGRIVTADASDLSALEAAAQPVYDQLNADPATAEALEAIQAMKSGLPVPSSPPTCDSSQPAGPDQPSAGPDTAGAFPQGVYRAELTKEQLISDGVNSGNARDIAGVFTMTFDGGTVTIHDVNAESGREHEDSGSYCVTDGRVTVSLDPDGCDVRALYSAAWTLDGRELRFTDLLPGDLGDPQSFVEAFWGNRVWMRID